MTTANPIPSNTLSNNKSVLVLAPTPYFSNRGCHIRIYEEVQLLQHLGYQPTLLTYPLGRNIGSGRIIRVPGLKSYQKTTAGFSWHKLYLDILLWRQAVRLIKNQRPHLVHAHLHESAWIGWLLKLQFKLPFVLDVQGMGSMEFPLPGYEYWAIKRADAVFVSSELTHKQLVKKYPHSKNKIVLLADGIGQTLNSNINPTKQYDVVYSGGTGSKKGTDILNAALQLVKQKRPNTSVLMITPNQPIPYEQLLPTLAKARVGIDPKPSSSSEGSAKVLNYIAAGLMVVTFKDYKLPNTIVPQQETAEGLAEAILQAVQQSPIKCDLTAYSWSERAMILEATYANIV